ncbi:helix-turn-helix domain-containing protein [Nostoc sp. CHAB 5834]|nr:helix-turn-helix domain-containing protein [Nostoc sp. CHAB 5834]
MGARLRVLLTKEQDAELFNLRTAQVPQKVKDRAEVIRLNAAGWYVEKIAAHFHWGEKTVRLVLHKWNKHGIQGLWELPGRGVKPKLKEVDIEYLERCLKSEARTYNSQQLAEKLEKELELKVSRSTVRQALKKKV